MDEVGNVWLRPVPHVARSPGPCAGWGRRRGRLLAAGWERWVGSGQLAGLTLTLAVTLSVMVVHVGRVSGGGGGGVVVVDAVVAVALAACVRQVGVDA